MHEVSFLPTLLFSLYFLAVTTVFIAITKKYAFPYTIALLVLGFITQWIFKNSAVGLGFDLSPWVTFYLLLPILLFESAMKLNFHQFKIQFKTITFLATFGFMLSVFVVGAGISLFLGLPLSLALLFGALISATDPISVIALFKQLGAPSRLRLIAEGESMFNDASAVIVFRIMLGLVLGTGHFMAESFVLNVGSFLYMFIASLAFGALLGYVVSSFIARVKNDIAVETTLTVVLALSSFLIAEHFLSLSGVISTVAAGLVLGNLGKTRFSSNVVHFIDSFWEYLAFISISLVFFYTAYNLDVAVLLRNISLVVVAYLVVIMARAVSVYVSFWLSNNLPLFKNEPNVPLSWQHVVNWGGLRGVIPLILVYELPESLPFREELRLMTFGVFLLSLVVNGLSVDWLVRKLGLHLPPKEERLLAQELSMLRSLKAQQVLNKLPHSWFSSQVLAQLKKKYQAKEQSLRNKLVKNVNKQVFLNSLRLQAIKIEENEVKHLFNIGVISEATLIDYQSELDIYRDAVVYPSIQAADIDRFKEQRLSSATLSKIKLFRLAVSQFRWLRLFVGENAERFIYEQAAFLVARIWSSGQVIDHLRAIERCLVGTKFYPLVREVKRDYVVLRKNARSEYQKLVRTYPKVMFNYQLKEAEIMVGLQIKHAFFDDGALDEVSLI